MDLDIIQSTKEGEITQFLCDVRDYFKASLETSEYENTSNIFYVTASEATERLLGRCECLLNRLNKKNQGSPINSTTSGKLVVSNVQEKYNNKDRSLQRDQQQIEHEDVSYLDMSAGDYKHNTIENNNDYKFKNIDDFNSSGDGDKTFQNSTIVIKQNKSFLHERHDTMIRTTGTTGTTAATATTATTATTTITTTKADEIEIQDKDINRREKCRDQKDKNEKFENELQIYDVCQITTQGSDGEDDEIIVGEKLKAITSDSYCSMSYIDCPYMDLPAGHLSIQKSTKYGQLQRIEKRLFFDQSKKCYCGILNDWLLCYVDGPTSNKPTISLYLKMPGIEIEHFGEGKRRDVCFQISTYDPNKRFIFQAINEIDAKEWIHAIETAIRSDINNIEVKNTSLRKLPTPPVMKKMTFLSPFQRGYEMSFSNNTLNDGIYEEPSSMQQFQNITKTNSEKPPELPDKLHTHSAMANKFEYDVPKCPAQPLKNFKENNTDLINPYTNNTNISSENIQTVNLSETNYLPSNQKLSLKIEENLDFQAKIKDVHNKLSSQLSGGPNLKKPLKKSVTSKLKNDSDCSMANITASAYNSPCSLLNELKKQKKPTLQNSPQKSVTEKSSFSKNWFLNRLNKSNSSTRSDSSSPLNSPSKCKQSEKENLLNSSSDVFCDSYEMNDNNLSSSPTSPILKNSPPTNSKSKVNMIINQLEASGHLVSIFSADAVASFSSFCDNDYNNYEPIMTVSTPLPSFMKKC